jgi:hypothetical protein
MDPGFAMGHFFLGQALEEQRAFPDAISALERSVELTGRSAETLSMLGKAHASAGHEQEARLVLDEITQMSSSHYLSPVLLAQLQLSLRADADVLGDCPLHRTCLGPRAILGRVPKDKYRSHRTGRWLRTGKGRNRSASAPCT